MKNDQKILVSWAILGILSASFLGACTDQPFTVDVPLRVVAVQPAGEGVARDAAVEATFSENLVAASVTDAANFFLEDITDPAAPVPVPASLEYDSDLFLVRLMPEALLGYSRSYRATLTTGILRERDEGPLPVRVTGTFRTLDPPPLRLVASNPGADSIGVPRGAEIVLTFSEPVHCASVEAGVVVTETFDPHPHTGPGERVVTGSWNCSEPDSIDVDSCEGNDYCVVTFTPDTPFAYSSNLEIALQGGSREDGAVESFRATDFGGQLPESLSLPMHVEDPPPFYLMEASPGSGLEGAPVDVGIRLVFNEPVDCASLTDNLLVTERVDDHPRFGVDAGVERAVAGQIACNPNVEEIFTCGDGGDEDPCVVRFTPEQPFDLSSLVTVNLQGGTYVPGQAPDPRVVESTRATSFGGNLTEDLVLSFRVEDPADLGLVALMPAPGAEMVDLGSDLVLTLSEAPLCDTFNDVTVRVTETLDPWLGGGTVDLAASILCLDGVGVVTLNPDLDFGYSSRIDVVLAGGAFDAATYPQHALESALATTRGGQLPASFTYFFMAADPPPLYVTGTSPSAGAIRVALDADVEVTFSEAVDCASVDLGSFAVQEVTDLGLVINHTGSFDCSGANVVFNPDADFQMTSEVTVSLSSDIRSARATSRGGSLENGFIFSFSTADPPPLLVVSTSPGGEQDNVSADAVIRVTFSEPVDRSSLDPGSFIVLDVSDPANPLPVACGDPDGTYLFEESDAVVICDPPADFDYDATIQVRLTTAIRSAQATSASGNLPFDVVWSFDVIPVPPIEVVDIMPREGAQNVPITTSITVVFSQDVLESTLVTDMAARTCSADEDCPGTVSCGLVNPGACDPDPANLTVWVNAGATSDISAALPLGLQSYDPNTFTAVFQPNPELPAGVVVSFTIRGGLSGVRGRFGGSILVADFTSHFTTGINNLLAGTIPYDGAEGVPVGTQVCAVFLEDVDSGTIDSTSFRVDFADDFGSHNVSLAGFDYAGVDPITREPDLTGTYTNNLVCARIDPAFWDCHPDARGLLYNTEYTVSLADTITNAAGTESLEGGYAWIFTTGGPPEVLSVAAENSLVRVEPLAGGSDVPINSAFEVILAGAVDAASLAGAAELLDAAGIPVPADVSLGADGDSIWLRPQAWLDYAASYRLVVRGGTAGLLLADGSYLDADHVSAFETSPPMIATVSPPQGEDNYPTAMSPIVFSRDVYLPSAASTAIYYTDLSAAPEPIQSTVATNAGDKDSVVASALPAYRDQVDVCITVTRDVLDFRGNPLAEEVVVDYSVGNTPALEARKPDPLTTANVVPAAATELKGDQEFVVTMRDVVGNLRNRMLPPTFNDLTVVLECTGGAAECVAGQIPMDNRYSVAPVAMPDWVTFRARDLLRSGCTYRLTVRQNILANIFGAGNGDGVDVVLDYTVESTPPTLDPADLRLDAMAGADLSADGQVDVWSLTDLRATFSENMDPVTFDPAHVFLVCDGASVAGVISVTGALLTFDPLQPLSAASVCDFTVASGVTDTAGNPLAAVVAAQFVVESTPPEVLAVSPVDGATGVALDASIVLSFSEALDPASVSASTVSQTGSLRLVETVSGLEVFGCIRAGSDASEWIFEPWQDLQSGMSYDVLVGGVSDPGGSVLITDFSSSFETQ